MPATETVDLTKIYRKYQDKWIALAIDMRKVYASGRSIDEVEDKLNEKGVSLGDVTITKLPRPDSCLAI